jgi:hypothetical protein
VNREGGEIGDRRGSRAERLGGGAGRDVDRDAAVGGDAAPFPADERAAVEAAGVRLDSDVVVADAEEDFGGELRGGEVEVGDAGRAVEGSIEEEIGGERRIGEKAAVGEMELFVDPCLDGGAGGEAPRG